MILFKSAIAVMISATVALADYGNHQWGYKADIYHPTKYGGHGDYGHGGHYGGGHSHVEVYHSKPMKHYNYHEQPMYHKKSYHHEDHYQPKHYEQHYEKPMEYYKPMYKEPTYYKPPPKKDDDHMDMKFNVEIPLKKMFDSVMKKGDDDHKPSGYGGGYEQKEEKKEFEIKIPKIDIDGIIDKMHDKVHDKESQDEYKKA